MPTTVSLYTPRRRYRAVVGTETSAAGGGFNCRWIVATRGRARTQGLRAGVSATAISATRPPRAETARRPDSVTKRSESREVCRMCAARARAHTTRGELHAVGAWSLPDDSNFTLSTRPLLRSSAPFEMCVALAVAFITRVSDATFRAAWRWRKRARPRALARIHRDRDRKIDCEWERRTTRGRITNSLPVTLSVCAPGIPGSAWILCYVWRSLLFFVWSPTENPLGSHGHDRGQPVRNYQHPGASRSHARETGETSLETDPRGALRGRGTAFRTVSATTRNTLLHLSLSLSLDRAPLSFLPLPRHRLVFVFA